MDIFFTGVGVDNMFIMVSSWQQTKVKSRVEERMGKTYEEAAVSITITTLTDVLAFYIGIMTSFGSVQSFCIYTGTAILFCFLYNITCFGAFLALNGRREESNRHWLVCKKVPEQEDDHRSHPYNLCCVGGKYSEITDKEFDHPITDFFSGQYGPFLTNTWTKIIVLGLYGGYLAGSIYGCFQVQEGIDLRNLATDRSYVRSFYDNEDLYFNQYGPRVMVVVTQEVSYWDIDVRNKIDRCMESFKLTSYVSEDLSESWLTAYLGFAELFKLNVTDENNFVGNLSRFFTLFSDFKQDVDIQAGAIKASRFFIQTMNVTSAIDEKNMLNQVRDTAKSCELKMSGCHADCLERPLSQGFRTLGKLIAKKPWYFVITPLILSVGLGIGLCFLEQRQINKLEELFTPEGGIAKSQRDFIRINFPTNESGQFSAQRLYTPGTFASLIIVSTSDNILITSVFKELQKLDMAVKHLTSKSGINFNQLCAQVNGSTCVSANPILNLMHNNTKDVLLTYPQLQNGAFVGLYIGGVMLDLDNVLLKAKALRFLYYLRGDNGTVHHTSIEWLHHFMNSISHVIDQLQLRDVKVCSSMALMYARRYGLDELDHRMDQFAMALQTLLSRMAHLESATVATPVQPMLQANPAAAPVSVQARASSITSIRGVGVDNMFIIISCWKQTKLASTIEERMADTYQEAAVSITITTLTDVLAFYIGIMTHFPSVQSFCIYTGTALVFCYIYCITFFGAILALNGIHEKNNRHCYSAVDDILLVSPAYLSHPVQRISAFALVNNTETISCDPVQDLLC
ncbi:hypothetical protein AB205_0134540 [Aquarana catesbeiana]|uniref:SSD domain-containing protein n=1 Tax=Aquarana catesbeiana TaxID=8400 RepID=A0A2G9SLN2_AQUCT|nr:hypothetical protein AB205_0134540 [Aquarana catesbeiana]